MYTGIVQGLEKILEIRQGDGFITLVISNDHDFFHDVFIGARAIILPGLHLCRYSVVGAGAVLTKNTTDFGIYAGNPARFIKERKIYGE